MTNPLIYEQEVLEMTGLAKSTISDWMANNRFPRKLFSSRKYGRVWDRQTVLNALCPNNSVDSQKEGFHVF